MLASWLPDLVLLDMSLPGIDGHEVLRRMRAQPSLAKLPCVAVSADAMPHQIARARTAGFDDYWVKPLDVPTLADRVLRYAPCARRGQLIRRRRARLDPRGAGLDQLVDRRVQDVVPTMQQHVLACRTVRYSARAGRRFSATSKVNLRHPDRSCP